MKSFFEKLIEFLLGLFREPKAVKVSGKTLFAPLFYVNASGKVDGTWNYLSKSFDAQKFCRQKIKNRLVSGETAAIAFLLTPNHEGGNLFSQGEPGAVNMGNLQTAVAAMKQLCKESIAVFVTLYTDDQNPRWTDIEKHQVGWQAVWKEIKPYVSGCLLSIESTERGDFKAVQHGIFVMRQCMPGAQVYGTHQQWLTKWNSGANTPSNADIIFAETGWHPSAGNNIGDAKFRSEINNIIAATGAVRLVIHEYNLVDNSKQRDWLRGLGLKGVG